jgi:hypothetical protein
MGRVLCERVLAVAFLPPGFCVASFMRSSCSMRPALRRVLCTSEREPEAGAGLGLENMVDETLTRESDAVVPLDELEKKQDRPRRRVER